MNSIIPAATAALLCLPASGLAQQQFTELTPITPGAPYGFGMALHDFDGDGDTDLATGPWGGSLRVFLNDGNGNLDELAGAGPPARLFTSDMTSADVDGDGDEDLVLVNFDRQLQLYLNNGDGSFTDRSQPSLGPITGYETAAFGDFDGDGAPDLMIAGEPGEPSLILFNDGTGDFTTRTTSLPSISGRAARIRVADLDDDDDLDAVVATNGTDVLLVNDGSGVMSASAQFPSGSQPTGDLQFGDVDGDGDSDAILVQSSPERVRVLLNDGAAGFIDRGAGSATPDPESPKAVALGDADEDGDLDLAVGTFGDFPVQLYLNDGMGAFTLDAGRMPPDHFDATTNVAFDDLDGDGDPDLVVGNQWTGRTTTQSRIYSNLQRQSHAPAPPRIASTYAIDLFSQPGYGTVATLSLPLLGTAAGTTPLGALGVLRIDPARTAVAALALIPAPSGRATLELNLPPDQALVGTPILSQALFIRLSGQARLGNLVARVIQPARDG